MFLVLLILNNPEQGDRILQGWVEAGASGVTLMPSIGLAQLKRGLHEELPIMPSLSEFFEREERRQSTLMSVVKDRDVVNRMVSATEKVTGNLNNPNTGLLLVLPVLEAYGLDRTD